MQIEKLFTDYGIPYVTEHKNVRSGWIGLECPFCSGEKNYHLGYSISENYFSCWRCGGHNTANTISKLLGVNYHKAEEIVEQYGGSEKVKGVPRVRMGTSRFKLPSGDHSLQAQHKLYLQRRKFDWEYLEEVWGIMGTGPMAKLDNGEKTDTILNYARRILAPISWDGNLVSFQARDITNKHMAKYMACPPARERISHKHILYGVQEHWQDRCIVVEGITDAWRLGTDAVATFGIKFTREQIKAIATHFKEAVVLFDPEGFAQAQARKLVDELMFKGIKAKTVLLTSDPGELKQEKADELVDNLMNTLTF